jgi:hypothetical protein
MNNIYKINLIFKIMKKVILVFVFGIQKENDIQGGTFFEVPFFLLV